jgi:hypothetical protein
VGTDQFDPHQIGRNAMRDGFVGTFERYRELAGEKQLIGKQAYRLLMGSGPLCSASNYSAARANAIGGETALQHMHHQSRHACPAAFARLTAVAQQKIYGWKSLGSNVNGVTAVIVIRSLPE